MKFLRKPEYLMKPKEIPNETPNELSNETKHLIKYLMKHPMQYLMKFFRRSVLKHPIEILNQRRKEFLRKTL